MSTKWKLNQSEMADTSSSHPLPVNSVLAGASGTATADNQREDDADRPDTKYSIHRQLNFTVSYHHEGTAKPGLIKRFNKWLRK